MKHTHVFLLFCLFSLKNSLSATVWLVGPTRTHQKPSAVANLVANGDTVEIDAGLYTGDVAKWYASNLFIRGVGAGRAHLAAGGQNAEGKAIWVVKGTDCRIENMEFSGCTVPDHNGAGIRQEGRNLTLRNCYFHHNEMGVLTSNDGVSDYLFEGCEFAFNGYGDGYSHNIYIGHAHSFEMVNCYSHDYKTGHLVKSRAQANYLLFNRLSGETGDGSYEIDLPNGGLAVVLGNIIEQPASSQNGGIISFGKEAATNLRQTIVLANNTIWNRRFGGTFLQVSNATDTVRMVNNLFVGPGTLLSGTTAVFDTTHNLRLADIAAALLTDPLAYDFRPLPNSPCVDAGTDALPLGTYSLEPFYQYEHPLAIEARTKAGAAWDLGAHEYPGTSSSDNPPGAASGFEIFPNPVSDGRLYLVFHQEIQQPTLLRVLDFSGNTWRTMMLPSDDSPLGLILDGCPAGLYVVEIQGIGYRVFVKN